ncbi:MAG: Hsp33 family molecular chaperone HslO [Clostridia bacterium]|nr:Hsp33 family molecular chaperone HslO [Clostridia bacterium]
MDILIRGTLADNSARFMAISGRELVEKARLTHDLSRVCTAALGRTLLITSIMGAELKSEDDKLTVIIKGEGLAGNLVCTSNHAAAVKGYIENPTLELPLTPKGKLDVGSAVGWLGKLTVIRDHSMKEPYVGSCNMVSGEIAEDFAQYFTVSEQTPSLVYLGVRVDSQSKEVLSAGGIVIQPLPNCDDSVIDGIEAITGDISNLAKMLGEGMELEEAINSILHDFNPVVLSETTPEFKCDCSRERLERVLISLGREELMDMIEKDGGAELTCQFCNSKYGFDKEQLEQLLKEIG